VELYLFLICFIRLNPGHRIEIPIPEHTSGEFFSWNYASHLYPLPVKTGRGRGPKPDFGSRRGYGWGGFLSVFNLPLSVWIRSIGLKILYLNIISFRLDKSEILIYYENWRIVLELF